MHRGSWAGALALAAAAVVACSAPGRAGQPSWRKPTQVAGQGGPGARAVEFSPESAPAIRYNDPPPAEPPHTPIGDAITRAVDAAAARLGKPAPVADPRLFAAAQALAEVAPENAPLPYALVEFAMQHNGIIEPSPHLVVIWGPVDDPAEIVSKLDGRLPDILDAAQFARVGIGSSRRGEEDAVTVLAFQTSFIETRPIPRSLPAGGTIEVEGSVRAPYTDPQVFVTGDRGEVAKANVVRRGANGFRAQVGCGKQPGKLQIEITAVDSSGSTVLANFPVWCNEAAPDRIVVDTTEDDTAPVTSGADGERRMAELVNRDRKAHGLPPLELDPELSKVARAHSDEMLKTGVVAHISPTTGSAVDRVNAGGIKSAVILENVARAYGIGEAEQGLMNSPGHRANILADRATHLGLGIVLGEDVAGRRELFITQLFIRRAAAIDVDVARRAAEAALVGARSSLAHDERLSQVAQEFAAAIVGGEATDRASQRAASRIKKMKTSYTSVTTVVTTVAEMAAFRPAASVSDTAISAFGVGLAQGDHDVIGEGAITIVLLLAKQ